MEDSGLTVKEVAALTGLSAHTLRYYERVDLIGSIRRVQSGHRRYSKQDIAWIEFLGRLRATGMPIRKMKRFADLRLAGDSTIAARRTLLEEHRTEVRQRITELERDLTEIDGKVDLYKEMESKDDAPKGTDGPDAIRARVG
ncbi:MAG: MerR family transcriptional regulator [Rubrobacteraceae bacterium]